MKFYLMHGESLGEAIEQHVAAAAAADAPPKSAKFSHPIEHEDGTVEFGDDPDYDRRDYEFGEYGFPDDGHDYSQYFRPMGQTSGVFVAADGTVSKSLPLSAQYSAPTMVKPTDAPEKEDGEKEDEAGKITKRMIKDGEILLRDAAAQKQAEDGAKKEGDEEEGEEGEVDENGDKVVVLGVPFVVQEQDDFEMQKQLHYKTMDKPDAVLDKILDAGEDEDEVDGVHVEEMPDDFIQQLMQGDSEEEGEFDDDDFFDGDEDEDDKPISRRPEGDALAGLEEQFDEVLKDYESDDIGDLSGDEETCGTMSVEDILAHLEAEETKEVDRLVRMHAARHVLSGPLVNHQYKDDDEEEDAEEEEVTTLEDGTRVKKLKHRMSQSMCLKPGFRSMKNRITITGPLH